MNRSGEAVGPVLRKRGIELADLIVVVDDVDIELGRLRIRAQGSPGGHNGLKSVEAALGSDAYVRIRVGVGRPQVEGEMVDHVLSRFRPDEMDAAKGVIAKAADALETMVADGLVKAMNGFNG